MPQAKGKGLDPEMRRAFTILLLEENPPPTLRQLVIRVWPELEPLNNKQLVSRREYQSLKLGMKHLPEWIRPFYGSYPESAKKEWPGEEDQNLFWQIRARLQHHQLRARVGEFCIQGRKNHRPRIQDRDLLG